MRLGLLRTTLNLWMKMEVRNNGSYRHGFFFHRGLILHQRFMHMSTSVLPRKRDILKLGIRDILKRTGTGIS
jgi:hypothetical protein